MHKSIVIGSALLAVAAMVAVLAVSASGDDGWQAEEGRRSLEAVFPHSVAESVAHSRPTDGETVAQARLREPDGSEWLLSATAKETLCASMAETTTCQPAVEVETKGLVMAAVDCQAQQIRLMGLVPTDVTSVTVLGSREERTKPSSQGVVRITVGNSVAGLSLSTGVTNPLKLDLGVICKGR